MSLSGWGYCYLAGAIEDGRWKYSPVTIRARREPWFRGTCADFIAQNPRQAHHLVNLVRVCPACSKSCARSVPACNNCATDLSLEPVSRTDNALMGFVYGIAAFPTSIRYEDEHFLVYDDLMQTTLIHLNAIPTDTYVPDLRYLFSDPRRGLELIKRLFALAVRAAVEILSVDDFAVKFFSPAALSLMEQLGKQTFVEDKVLAGKKVNS